MKVRKTIASIIFFLMSLNLFAHSGYMAGAEDIRITRTKYFDIIFPAEREESASLLVQKADDIFEEICAQYLTYPSFRLPVVITPATDIYNAYFTNYWYNHIVLLDTMPTETMDINTTSLLSTFRHELTHAVSTNIREKDWLKLDNTFSDALNWGYYVVMTSFFKEGATVTEESRMGEGRLNDGYYLHLARQAKLQEEFPSYADVTGSRDIYPSGTSYYAYGGMFADYLQQKYGMEKYAKLWYKAVNGNNITYKSCFEQNYGTKLSDEWTEFKNSISLPDIPKNPLDDEDVSPYTFSQKRKGGFRYESLSTCKEGVAFIEKNTSSVYFAKYKDDGSLDEAKKLFTKDNLERISFSSDGKFLAVNWLNLNSDAIKGTVSLYDLKKKSWAHTGITSARDSTIVLFDGEYYLLSVLVHSKVMSLDLKKIDLDKKGKIKSFSQKSSYTFPREESVRTPCDAGDGNVALIHRKGSAHKIMLIKDIFSFDEKSFFEHDFPLEGAHIRDLLPSYSSDKKLSADFSFSWATKDTFPRFGKISFSDESSDDESEIKSALYSYQEKDISGGVYEGAILPNGKVFFSSIFVTRGSLNFLSQNLLSQKEVLSDKSISEKTADEEREKISIESEPYKKLFWDRGLFLPLAYALPQTSPSTDFPSLMLPGITWRTSNPWDSLLLNACVGFDVFTGIMGSDILIKNSTQTGMFQWSVQNTLFYGRCDFFQDTNKVNLQLTLKEGNNSSLILFESNNNFFGEYYNEGLAGILYSMLNTGPFTKDFFESNSNEAGVQYSYKIKTGAGQYEKFLFLANISYADYLDLNLSTKDFSFTQQISSIVKFQLPSLIPISCVEGLTYNLPLAVKAKLYPSSKILLSTEAEGILFASEIQKGFSFIPVYLNRFICTADYQFYLDNQNDNFQILNVVNDFKSRTWENFTDILSLKLMVNVTYNSGAPASPEGMFLFGLSAGYSFSHKVPVVNFSTSILF